MIICQKCQAEMPRMNYCGNCRADLFETCPKCGQIEPVKRKGCLKKAEEKKQAAIQDAKKNLDKFIKERADGMKRKIRVNVSISVVVAALIYFALFWFPVFVDFAQVKNYWAYACVLFLILAIFIFILLGLKKDFKRWGDEEVSREFAERYPAQATLIANQSYFEWVSGSSISQKKI